MPVSIHVCTKYGSRDATNPLFRPEVLNVPERADVVGCGPGSPLVRRLPNGLLE